MPGIFGFSGYFHDQGGEKLLKGMALSLEINNLYDVHTHFERGFGIGKLSYKNIPLPSQPIWTDQHDLWIGSIGEIYNADELREMVRSKGVDCAPCHIPELVYYLYKTFGEDFAGFLNGHFAIVIWNSRTRKLTVINDRLGMHPIYYTQTGNGLLFASGVRALLADPDLSREIDPVGVAQFLTFDHLLHDRTLLSNVKLLPQASIMTYTDGQLEIRPYFTLQYPQHYENRTQMEYLEGLLHNLRTAIQRQAPPPDLAAGLLLSGGMDSRYLLALLAEYYNISDLHTFTWGIPGCDDARIARETAGKMGSQHHFFELQPDYLLHKAKEAVRLTDGMGNIINLHALATLEEETQYAQLLYKGFLGDAMMGFALQRPFWADYDDDTAEAVHLSIHDYQGVYYYDRDAQKKYFSEGFHQSVGNCVFDEYRRGMHQANHSQLAVQRLYYDFKQRVPRHTLNGVIVARSRALVRLPFGDNDLVDYSLTIPPGYHFGRHLMRLAFLQSYPELAKIPLTDTGLPMISCARDLLLRAKQFAQWHANKRGFNWPTRRPYKDYNNWFRTVLRSWVESTLLSESSLDRGYLKPEYIRHLVNSHMAGEDQTIRLGQLMTLELWHRQYID